MSHTLTFLRNRGMAARKTEQYIRTPKGGFRRDLFGGDALAAIGSDLVNLQLGITSHHAAKVTKALSDPEVKLWLNTRNKFLVWTWGKRVAFKKDGTKKRREEYKAKITEIRLSGDCVEAVPFELFL